MSVCLCVCLRVNPAARNHDCCTSRLIILHEDPDIHSPPTIHRTVPPPRKKNPSENFPEQTPGHFTPDIFTVSEFTKHSPVNNPSGKSPNDPKYSSRKFPGFSSGKSPLKIPPKCRLIITAHGLYVYTR